MSRFEIKIVAALLLIAVIPLAASVVLVGQVIKVSDSVAEGQSRRLARPLERAAEAYRGLFAARKRVFRLEAKLLAREPALLAALDQPDEKAVRARLEELARASRDIVSLEVLGGDGQRRGVARGRVLQSAEESRELSVEALLPDGARRLRVVFHTPRAPFDDFRNLGQVQGAAAHLNRLREELATFYRVTFVILFGAVLLVTTLLGLFIARRTTRRVAVLAAATKKVAAGDLETQVQFRTRDELGDLAVSFNEMVGEIKESRERIAYLEKIGAWQEIARRLAHEIKNPLTPIQLAVQQLHRKYRGEDPEFTRMLEDATEIITEEVGGLRRLVGEFSAFAKLPSVKPEPVDLNGLVDDFLKSHPDLEQKAEILWTPVAPPCQVLVDRMLIKHVLFNLVENAIQAAEEAGQAKLCITLGAETDPLRKRALITVADDGPGMDPDTVRKVFDPYFTTKERGTGLGLAIVKKIVLEHNGRISLSSHESKGTQFMFTLPVA
jgi:nitrogen fixation/metabolism regulation signal transduction histidine kinase